MSLIETLEARKAEIEQELDTLISAAEKEERAFSDEETTKQDELVAEHRTVSSKIESQKAADEVRKQMGQNLGTAGPSAKVVSEANPVYRRGDLSTSFFRDLVFQKGSDAVVAEESRQRLIRSQETRALSTSATAGGTLAPPEWIIEEYVKLARPARVTADLMTHVDLKDGESSVNLPKISTGTTVAIVQTQNTAISQTDLVTTSLSSNITTISGGQTVSIQLMRQSGTPIDQVVLGDLALAYASQLGIQVISGSGANGQLKGLATSGTTVTFTTTTPAFVSTTAAASLYNKILSAVSAVNTTRYLPADSIVMHPARWAWIQESLDGNSRLQVNPSGPIFNNAAVVDSVVAQGAAGALAGLPVYLDPNILQNLGAATNQDQIYVIRRGDNWLWETPLEAASFDATYANQNSIFFRVLGFSAFIARYAGSVQVIDGTGMVVPTL